MDAEMFEKLVEEAFDALPEDFKSRLNNVEVIVEEWPDRRTMRLAHVRHPAALLGFYHGVPLTERNGAYTMVPPDRISLYREPILLVCRTDAEVQATVNHVLLHEIAHHFGISDARLREIGAY
jgi:predicted Zn-dependent protease with MMP-like domain